MSETPILEDYLELVTYGFTNPMPDSDVGPWKITAKDVIDGEINFNTARKTTQEAFDTKLTKKSRPKIGDVLLTKDGTLGRLAIVKEENICINQSVAVLRPNEKILPEYLFYLLSTPEYQRRMIGDSDGTVIKHIYITRVGKMEVDIPSIEEQKERLKHLLSLDGKIKLNRQINQTLEQIAQAIFKSWFVDFEPVKAKIEAKQNGQDPERAAMCAISGKTDEELDQLSEEQRQQLSNTAALFPDELEDSELGEVPRGWCVKTIDDVTSLIIDHRGKTPKKLGGDWSDSGHPVLSAKIIKAGRIVNRQNIRFVSEEMYSRWMKEELEVGDVLITSEAPMGEMFFLTENIKYCLSQRLYALRANSQDVTPSYLYIWLQTATAQADLEGRATGTTVVGIRQVELRKISVLSPRIEIVENYEKLVFPLLRNLYEKEDENIVLGQLRDELLSKLLTGDISISNIAVTKGSEFSYG